VRVVVVMVGPPVWTGGISDVGRGGFRGIFDLRFSIFDLNGEFA
jgi:hypothetical protein